MREVLRTQPREVDEDDLIDAPRGYGFVGVGAPTVCLCEIASRSTLCGRPSQSPGLRYAPRATSDAKVHGKCRRAWKRRERTGHPAGLMEKAQAFEDAVAQRVANAAAIGG